MATTTRTRTARLRRWVKTHGGYGRLTLAVVLVGTTSIAMYVSYWHIAFDAAYFGEGYDSAHLYPLMIDGLMLLSSLLRAADKAAKLRPRRWATVTLFASATMTLACNGLSSALTHHGVGGLIIGAWAAASVVAGSEMITTKGRSLAVIKRERDARAAARVTREAERITRHRHPVSMAA